VALSQVLSEYLRRVLKKVDRFSAEVPEANAISEPRTDRKQGVTRSGKRGV
jgi:hypothetical protein